MVVSCTSQVLAVCTAVWYLYRACAYDTWHINSPCKANTLQCACCTWWVPCFQALDLLGFESILNVLLVYYKTVKLHSEQFRESYILYVQGIWTNKLEAAHRASVLFVLATNAIISLPVLKHPSCKGRVTIALRRIEAILLGPAFGLCG